MRVTAGALASLMGLVAGLTVLDCESSEQEVVLREFPYPYQAALAVCSDIDRTTSIGKFLEIQEFLDSDGPTAFGPGLALDIGNSFWFYNQYFEELGDPQVADSGLEAGTAPDPNLGISLFVGISDTLWPYADTMMGLIKSGHLDCLHSYGHFREDGFTRDLAVRAADLFARESLTVDVFINHGTEENQNNIGEASWFLGDDPGSSFYHSDLTASIGVKFLWRGQVTHCIGQNGRFSLMNLAKQAYEFLQDLMYSEQSYPHDNQLVHVCQLDDTRKVFEFVRYINPCGRYSIANKEYFAHQLGPNQVDDLIDSQGYMVFYTHLGSSPNRPYLSSSTVEAFQYVKGKFDEGELLVATTSQLLNYYVHHRYLFWRCETRPDEVHILIDSIANEVEGSFIPTLQDLAGVTFYVPECWSVAVSVAGELVPSVQNPMDHTGRASVSIPWIRLPSPGFDSPPAGSPQVD